jgi:hypothetical protein
MSNIDTSMVVTAAQTEASAQAELRAAITVERNRRLNAGVVVAVTGYGNIAVQGRPTDQINLIALGDTARDLQDGGVTAAVIPFRDGNNATHNLTAVEMIEVVRKSKIVASGLYAAAWALKDAAIIPADFADDRHWP